MGTFIAFKTPSSNGKLIITKKVKDKHIFHAVATLFYSLQKSSQQKLQICYHTLLCWWNDTQY